MDCCGSPAGRRRSLCRCSGRRSRWRRGRSWVRRARSRGWESARSTGVALGVGALDARDDAIGARDGCVDCDCDVEEGDALWQLDCGSDCGVGLRDAVDGGGEALQKGERVALAGRGRAARCGCGCGASGCAGGARADYGVAGASFLRNFWTWAEEAEEAEEAEAIFAEAGVGGMWFFGLCGGNSVAYIAF